MAVMEAEENLGCCETLFLRLHARMSQGVIWEGGASEGVTAISILEFLVKTSFQVKIAC